MKPFLVLLSALSINPSFIHAQVWSTAQPVAPSGESDEHASFVNNAEEVWFFGDEWLTFSRFDPATGGRQVCVLRSMPLASSWPAEPVPITSDSAINDRPSLARRPLDWMTQELMIAYERWDAGSGPTIYWSRRTDSLWSLPQPIDGGGGDDHTPFVNAADTTFAIVWMRGGAILFAEFRGGIWSPAVQISPPGDTSCTNPQIQCISIGPHPLRWFAAWESGKPGETAKAIRYTLGSDTGWTAPDTLAWTGDNRHPRLVRTCYGGTAEISWESDRTGDWEIYRSFGAAYGGTWSWGEDSWNTSNHPGADDRHASLQLVPVITEGGTNTFFIASAWTVTSGGSDSVMLSSWGGVSWQYRSAGPGAEDRRSDIAGGVMTATGVRVWAMWESNLTGRWKLYGSSIDITLDVEGEDPALPGSARMWQNYPNPFNPVTTIRYAVPRGTHGRTSLQVYDILGRLVATLVDEPLEPGVHTVQWNAAGYPSGVYFYHLRCGSGREFGKMQLLR